MSKLKNFFTLSFLFLLCLSAQMRAAQAVERDPFQKPLPVAATNAALAQATRNASLPLADFPSRLYPLSYVQAAEISESLQPFFQNKLHLVKSSNALLLMGSEAEHKRLAALLRELDAAGRQVTLEAKIIALSQEANKSLGVNWNWDTIPRRENNSDDDDDDDDDTDSGSNDAFGGNFKFWRGYAFRFNATLNALISDGKAKVLAKPRIITIPGKEASIFIGDHIPVQTEKHDSSGYYTATEYLDAGIKLQYLPLISADGKMVTAKVHTEVSTPVLISELKNYRITSRTADTNVRMFSGETLVIGGLISEEEQDTLQKIPLLGDIPLLKHLFRNHTKKRSKVEVVLLLTPQITEAGVSPAIYQLPEAAGIEQEKPAAREQEGENAEKSGKRKQEKEK